jgi:RHS repeat-associated protein
LGYDQEDRLTNYTSPTTTATYGYNGDGLRTSKTVAGATTQFAYDTSGSLPLILTDDTYKYLYGPDGLPFAQVNSSGVTTWLEHDLQGSTRVLTKNTGGITGSYTYTPYGAVSGHTGTATTPLQYTSQYTDTETGYQYLRARYYDPATANFLTSDPLVAATGDPYSYAGADPIDENDPSGLCLGFHGGCPGAGVLDHVLHSRPGRAITELDVNFWNTVTGGGINEITGGAVDRTVCQSSVFARIGQVAAFVPLLIRGKGEAERGQWESTGRGDPVNLRETLAMRQARSNPAAGTQVPIQMTDSRWPAERGWIKMQQQVAGVKIHYVYNTRTGQSADFKFK